MKVQIPPLKSKATFEVTEFAEKAGMISIYRCSKCEKLYLYTYIASGITPLKLKCMQCGEIAWVEEDVEQPSCVWYRPENLNELRRIAVLAYGFGMKQGFHKDMSSQEAIDTILRNYVIHYNNGKLFAKLLNPETEGK